MFSRRFLVLVALTTTATAFYLLGDFHARADEALELASYEAKLDAIRAEVHSQLGKERTPEVIPAGTTGAGVAIPEDERRAQMIADIKRELQTEMGLLSVQLVRERRSSFVELYSSDNLGKTNYGTAGYLGTAIS